MENTSFSITLAGKGWEEKLAEATDEHKEPPKKEMVARVSGPEPGYIATPICMVQAALTVIREAEKLPLAYYFAHLLYSNKVINNGITLGVESILRAQLSPKRRSLND